MEFEAIRMDPDSPEYRNLMQVAQQYHVERKHYLWEHYQFDCLKNTNTAALLIWWVHCSSLYARRHITMFLCLQEGS